MAPVLKESPKQIKAGKLKAELCRAVEMDKLMEEERKATKMKAYKKTIKKPRLFVKKQRQTRKRCAQQPRRAKSSAIAKSRRSKQTIR